MTSPVSGTNTTSIMMQTSFRRELQGELLEIEMLLKQHGGSDEKTLEIINWHRLLK